MKFRTGLCLVCHVGFGVGAVLLRLGSGAPPNFPSCSVRFLKTGIVESSWKLVVQLYFHYPVFCQNWLQKTGSFPIFNLIYKLKKFPQSPLKKEKVRFLLSFFSDFRKWIKLQNPDLHFALWHRTRILIHYKTTDHLPRLFLVQFQTFGHILIELALQSGSVSSQKSSEAIHTLCALRPKEKKIHLKQLSSVPVAGQMVLWIVIIHQQNRGRKCFKARLYYFP